MADSVKMPPKVDLGKTLVQFTKVVNDLEGILPPEAIAGLRATGEGLNSMLKDKAAAAAKVAAGAARGVGKVLPAVGPMMDMAGAMGDAAATTPDQSRQMLEELMFGAGNANPPGA